MINTVINLDKEFVPIKETNGIYTVSFQKENIYDVDEKTGAKKVSKFSQWLSFDLNHKPTVFEIKNTIEAYYNKIISDKIIYYFSWNGMQVELKEIDQNNYKAAWDLAFQTNGGNLPVTFKFKKDGKNTFYTFDNLDELKDFYLAINKHIQNSLEEGWQLKESINYSLYEI